MKIEIYLNLLEFRNSISNYIILEEREDEWTRIRGVEDEYYYKEFNGYAILLSHDFPMDKTYVFEDLRVNKLREILDQPGRVKYYLTLEITNNKLQTTEEDCLNEFPGIEIVNGILSDFQFIKDECCVKVSVTMDNIDYFKEALYKIIKAFQLYYTILKRQEEIAIEITKRFLMQI